MAEDCSDNTLFIHAASGDGRGCLESSWIFPHLGDSFKGFPSATEDSSWMAFFAGLCRAVRCSQKS
jgi:hypothetical protein